MRGLKLAAEELEEGGFSGAVCTDDAITVSVVECKIHVFEEKLTAEAEGKIMDCDHRNLLCDTTYGGEYTTFRGDGQPDMGEKGAEKDF